MDILSKETLALLNNKTMRETVEKVLAGGPGEPTIVTVTITAPNDQAGACEGHDGKVESTEITVRRLST